MYFQAQDNTDDKDKVQGSTLQETHIAASFKLHTLFTPCTTTFSLLTTFFLYLKTDESSSEDEEDPLSVLEDIKPDDDTKTNDKSNDEEEGQEEVKKYFECLASTPTEETPPELPKEPSPESNKIDKPLPFLGGRLSISARFLSRSLLTSGR